MMPNMCTVYVEYPVSLPDMSFTMLRYSSFRAGPLPSFLISFGYTQLVELEMYPYEEADLGPMHHQ